MVAADAPENIMADLLHPDATEQEDSSETPFDPGDFVLAMEAEDQMQAQLLVAACEDADIPAILQSPRSGPVPLGLGR